MSTCIAASSTRSIAANPSNTAQLGCAGVVLVVRVGVGVRCGPVQHRLRDLLLIALEADIDDGVGRQLKPQLSARTHHDLLLLHL